jgi:hypothetical protein
MPAAEQAAAYSRVHSAEAATNLSAMTVEFMFAVVTHSGVSSTERTDLLVCGSVRGQLRRPSGGVTPARTYRARAAAPWASR